MSQHNGSNSGQNTGHYTHQLLAVNREAFHKSSNPQIGSQLVMAASTNQTKPKQHNKYLDKIAPFNNQRLIGTKQG